MINNNKGMFCIAHINARKEVPLRQERYRYNIRTNGKAKNGISNDDDDGDLYSDFPMICSEHFI